MSRSGGEAAVGWSVYKRLLTYVRPYWALFAASVISFLVGSGAEAVFVRQFGNLIDDWDAGLADAALFIPLAMVGAALVRGVGSMGGEMLLGHVSFTVVHNLRLALFDQFLHMPSAYFDSGSSGRLVARITFNVGQLRDTGTEALRSVIHDGGKVIVFLAYMLYLNWQLTLIFFGTVPIVALVVLYTSRRFRNIAKRIQSAMGDVAHVVSETVSGHRVVRIFGGEDYERRRFQQASSANRRRNLKMLATKVGSTQIIQILVVIALSFLIGLLARPELAHGLSTGDLVVFIGLAGMLVRPIRKLTEVNSRLQTGLAAAEDVFAQLDAQPEVDQGEVRIERVQGTIEFRKVNFSYSAEQEPVLRDISLTVKSGQTIALVGRSGSGKSTLASLIPRFEEANSGEVLIDGVPVQEYNLASLRRQIALVTQQVNLFNDTLRANIAYGDLAGADAAAIEDAVRCAQAAEFVNQLPQGLDTLVGANGSMLSGGERQRIAIARALLKDAPILILDEATSALDSRSERHIQAALEEVMRERTTIVIAHRLSTVETADVIYVMDQGRIVEQGDHDSLLAQGGLYASLYDNGLQGEEAAMANTKAGVAGRLSRLGLGRPVERAFSPLLRAWHEGAWWTVLLTPAAWLFGWLAKRRRWRFLVGKAPRWRAPVPLIVVGNISVGGTGKTPLVIWLALWLKEQGLRVGVVARGYGGKAGRNPLAVPSVDADPALYGDEPVLIANRTGCPVVVCKDRIKAAKKLLEANEVDALIADDGLQHYSLVRDVEIAVVDGDRGFGNGRLLPAGPLREPASRLREVDWVVSNSRFAGVAPDEALMCMRPNALVNLGNGLSLTPEEFVERHERVRAVAGIGNPDRFARTLREMGLGVLLHGLDDHHIFNGEEVAFDDDLPVVCTDKDAVKLCRLKRPLLHCWRLEVGVELAAEDISRLRGILAGKGILE